MIEEKFEGEVCGGPLWELCITTALALPLEVLPRSKSYRRWGWCIWNLGVVKRGTCRRSNQASQCRKLLQTQRRCHEGIEVNV